MRGKAKDEEGSGKCPKRENSNVQSYFISCLLFYQWMGKGGENIEYRSNLTFRPNDGYHIERLAVVAKTKETDRNENIYLPSGSCVPVIGVIDMVS